jgi:hypothetical protein
MYKVLNTLCNRYYHYRYALDYAPSYPSPLSLCLKTDRADPVLRRLESVHAHLVW